MCKASFRRQVQKWFSSNENQQIQNYIKPKDVKFDMKMNVLKSLQAKLITFLFDRIKSRSCTITIGWTKIRHYSYFATGYTLKERITICGTNPTLFLEKLIEKKILFRAFFYQVYTWEASSSGENFKKHKYICFRCACVIWAYSRTYMNA